MINTLSESTSLKIQLGIPDGKSGLRQTKNQSHDKLILSHSDISSLRNNFDPLTVIIDNNIDILLISDTKLDDLFPLTIFKVKGFYFPN